jgi:hypothetical protein
MNFHVGHKVTMKNAEPWEDGDEAAPVFGVVYTIRAVDIEDNGVYLRFTEVRNDPGQYANAFGEVNWDAEEFRPLIDRKTDISTLTALLDPANHKQLEPAGVSNG